MSCVLWTNQHFRGCLGDGAVCLLIFTRFKIQILNLDLGCPLLALGYHHHHQIIKHSHDAIYGQNKTAWKDKVHWRVIIIVMIVSVPARVTMSVLASPPAPPDVTTPWCFPPPWGTCGHVPGHLSTCAAWPRVTRGTRVVTGTSDVSRTLTVKQVQWHKPVKPCDKMFLPLLL